MTPTNLAPEREATACSICENAEQNTIHTTREMMFGLREPFRYLECHRCGCLSLLDVPSDMSKYYPDNYYSFQEMHVKNPGMLRGFLKAQVSAYQLGGTNVLGMLLGAQKTPPEFIGWLREMHANLNSKIIDIGCGSGFLINTLKQRGFRNVSGADPYIQENTKTNLNVPI